MLRRRGRKAWTVAVVGGGPAGAATALSLARRGVEGVLLLEAGAPAGGGTGRRPAIGESLPPAATPALRALGVLDTLEAGGHLPCPGSRSLWGGGGPGCNDFLFAPEGTGWHLDRALFDAQLRGATAEAGVEVRTGARLGGVEVADAGVHLRVGGPDGRGTRLRTRFVVDATGPSGTVTRRLHVARNVLDRLVSVCAVAETAPGRFRRDYTLLEATEDGWWYAARLPRDRLIVSFTSDPPTLRARRLHAPAPFRQALERTRLVGPAVTEALGEEALRLVTRAAPVMILSRVVGPSWLAVGDAASRWDPLSSAGITKALQHGIGAGEAVAEWLATGVPTGLEAYQAQVFADFTEHVKVRYGLYRAEGRWPRSPFWAGRGAGVQAGRNRARTAPAVAALASR